MGVVTLLPFDHMTLINLFALIERPQGLGSSMQTLKLSSTYCVKYFVIINSANFARKTNALVVLDLLAGSCICK